MSARKHKDWMSFLLSYLSGRAEGRAGMSDIDIMHKNLRENSNYAIARQQYLHGASDRVACAILDCITATERLKAKTA